MGRKRVKKIRAVLHLLEKALGDNFRTHDRRLKAVGHQLSSLRDVDAEAETMKAVRDHYPRLVTPSMFAGVCRGLAKQSAGRWRVSIPTVYCKSWPSFVAMRGRCPDTFAAVADYGRCSPGWRDYRRARTAMDAVRATPEDAGFTRGGAVSKITGITCGCSKS
jgi:hypothetical protein